MGYSQVYIYPIGFCRTQYLMYLLIKYYANLVLRKIKALKWFAVAEKFYQQFNQSDNNRQ